jgi:hypothetical protein
MDIGYFLALIMRFWKGIIMDNEHRHRLDSGIKYAIPGFHAVHANSDTSFFKYDMTGLNPFSKLSEFRKS